MKKNTSAIILIVIAVFLIVFQFIQNNKTVTQLRKQVAIESAKTNFVLQQFNDKGAPFDSVYTKNDTVLYYKNGVFIGKSVIVIE